MLLRADEPLHEVTPSMCVCVMDLLFTPNADVGTIKQVFMLVFWAALALTVAC